MKRMLRKLFLVGLLLMPWAAAAQTALPLSQGFEAETSLAGWRVISANEENEDDQGRSEDAAKNGNYGFRFSSYNGADNEDYTQYLVTPELQEGTREIEVSFWYRNSEEDVEETFAVGYSATAAISAFTFGAVTSVADAEWHLFTATVPAGTKYVAIRYTAPQDRYYLYVDDISLEQLSSCAGVASLAASAVSTSSVSLSWADASNTGATYTVRNAATGAVLATGLTTPAYTATGLAASTEYTFSVTATCTNGDESRAASLTVRTACGVISAFPHSEGFEGGMGCWVAVSSNGENADSIGCYRGAAKNGRYGFRFSSYESSSSGEYTQFLVSPELVAGTRPLEVSFWYRNTEAGTDEPFALGWSSTTADTAAFTFDTVVLASDAEWHLYSAVMPAGTRYMAIRYSPDRDLYFLYVDDIDIQTATSCAGVASLAVGTVTANSAVLTWSDATNAGATYTVRNAATGAILAAGLSATTYTVTGLSASTDYTFSVTATCTNGDESRAGRVSVRTSCGDVSSFPYTEGFDSGLGCWTTVSGNPAALPWTDTVGSDEGRPHSGTGMAMSQSYDGTASTALEPSAWLISPLLVIPQADSVSLSWWFKVFGNYPHEHYSVFLSTTGSDTSDFTVLLDSLTADASHDDWTLRSVNLSAYAGQSIRIAFLHHSTQDQYWLLVDDVTVSTHGNAPAPPATYTVTVSRNPVEGSVSGAGTYADGASVTLSATPATGYHFVGWLNGTDTVHTNPYTFTIHANMAFTALFGADAVPVTYSVAVNHNPAEGSVSGAGDYADGASVTLTATPDAGYRFVGWLNGTDTVRNNPYTFAIHANMAFTALFEADGSTPPSATYTVTVNHNAAEGDVSGAGTYTDGATVTLTATPAAGYRFVGWVSGTDTVRTNPYSFVIHANSAFTALFVQTDGIGEAVGGGFEAVCTKGAIAIYGAAGRAVSVYDLNGRLLHHGSAGGEVLAVRVPAPGVYLVKVGHLPARKVAVSR